jgi:hypothetical protein
MEYPDSSLSPIIKDVKISILHGEGLFFVGNRSEKSSFEISYTASEAYISFLDSLRLFENLDDANFDGKLEDGRTCTGNISGNISNHNSLIVASCSELIIGKLETLLSIETVLIGVYFPYEFSFDFKEYRIAFSKSTTLRELAKRTSRMAGTFTEGNVVTISGSQLDIDCVNDLLRDICLLLRPITASEVYFRCLKCNNEIIVYHKNRLIGKHFGIRCNILESTKQYPDFLLKGLKKMEIIDDFDKASIRDIGHALSISAAGGLIETGLMLLISSLERLSQKSIPEIHVANNNYQFISNLQQFKHFLKEQANIYFEGHSEIFYESQKVAIIKSISRIQPWDTAFMKKIQTHLNQNGWAVELDFDILKELRDSLAHSGMLPTDIPFAEAFRWMEKLEVFLLVHVLDLVGFNGRISSSKDGWVVYPLKEDVKENVEE